ncbi:PilT/PilU family type 4a pilus ATPase [Candidatus Berkelbacteria bacterium]|nr:PilT/PilU family type 4a pilus ATPase [Candidatus Berkelbacteria bacterium]
MSERNFNQHISEIFSFAIKNKASDIHVRVSVPPVVRIDGKLRSVPSQDIYTAEAAAQDVLSTLTDQQKDRLDKDREVDYSFYFEETRVRANLYHEKENLVGAFRLIPSKIRTIEELGLPEIISDFAKFRQGFFIVAGPTGHGKSTTLAAMINDINKSRSENIITIEDPLEYIFTSEKSIISQREVGSDTNSFSDALRGSLRQDPDVILIGEMRDLETIGAALTLAETGHLVLSTLHTNNAAQTADRIIDIFPSHQQAQIRSQLANVLLGIVSQRLLPKVSGGRVAAAEILVANNSVRNTIREAKTHQINNIIQTGASDGMVSLDDSLANLVTAGEVSIDDALTWAQDPKHLKLKLY